MKRNFLWLSVCLLPCLLLGCEKSGTIRVVTGVSITAHTPDSTVQRHYSQDHNISNVLNYLRLLDPYTSVELDPETFRSGDYEIIISYSDGAHTVYRQIYQDYLQKDGGHWKRIDPELGSRLQELIEKIPDDEMTLAFSPKKTYNTQRCGPEV